jgi:hypothetical protein
MASPKTPFRKHYVSPVIQFMIRLIQMDVVRSDRVYVQYSLVNKDDPDKPYKGGEYHKVEDFYRYAESHSKVHYENYYKGREFKYQDFKIIDFRNTNRFRALRGL